MKTISSAEFRKTYQRLDAPIAVTVLGRVIGHYVPISVAMDDRFLAGLRPGEPSQGVIMTPQDFSAIPPAPYPTAKAQQAERDAILRKVNRGG